MSKIGVFPNVCIAVIIITAISSCNLYIRDARITISADRSIAELPPSIEGRLQFIDPTYKIFDKKYPDKWPEWLKIPDSAYLNKTGSIKEKDLTQHQDKETNDWHMIYQACYIIESDYNDHKQYIEQSFMASNREYQCYKSADDNRTEYTFVYQDSRLMIVYDILDIPNNNRWVDCIVNIAECSS